MVQENNYSMIYLSKKDFGDLYNKKNKILEHLRKNFRSCENSVSEPKKDWSVTKMYNFLTKEQIEITVLSEYDEGQHIEERDLDGFSPDSLVIHLRSISKKQPNSVENLKKELTDILEQIN